MTGETTIKNTESGADFDLAMIEALPKITVKTSSPWTEGVAEFEAVRLIDLLAAAGASGTTIKAAALNDYAVDLPMTDATEAGAFVAYKLNGEYMSVRIRGRFGFCIRLMSVPNSRPRQSIRGRSGSCAS